MVSFEVCNELSLKVTLEHAGIKVHTKVGSMIGMQGEDASKPVSFSKELLGPGNGAGFVNAAFQQALRRVTGENLPLMLAKSNGYAELYLADQGAHVIAFELDYGESIYVESENLLAFTEDCQYNVASFAAGVISQGGLAKSKLTGRGPNAHVAITCLGNPIQLNGDCVCDPDCFIASTTKPTVGFDIDFKSVIGQTSGESYNLVFSGPDSICVIQPFERKSGFSLSMDGGDYGSQPQLNTGDAPFNALEDFGSLFNNASRFLR